MRRAALSLSAVLFALALPAAAAARGNFLERNPQAQVTLRAGTTAPSLVTGLEIPLAAGDATEAVRALLTEEAEFFGFDSALSALEARAPQTAGRFTYYRFGQTHLGLPVLGADVVATVDEKGRVRIVGDALVHLGQLPTSFLVTGPQAVAAAVAAVKPVRWSGEPKLVRRAFAGIAGEWRAVWEVVLSVAEPFGSFHVSVDSLTGEVLQAANHRWTLNQGKAYLNCPEAGSPTQVDLIHMNSTTNLIGSYVEMYSNCMPPNMSQANCSASNRVAKPDTNGDYLFTPNEGSTRDAFAEVHTYYHLNQMHDWFAADGFTGLDFPMKVAVNYTQDFMMSCNAGYSDDAIVVGLCNLQWMTGSPGYVNFAYDSLSVMHEYSHGAVDNGAAVDWYNVDPMGLVGQQMGLHEGFADFFPAVLLDDPQVGRHVGAKTDGSPYLRTLTEFRSCPANIVGEPHEDGQIWGSANWEAYVASAKDPQLPRAVFEGLLALTTRPTFQDAAMAVLAVAQAAHPDVQDELQAAYTAHGLMACGREVELASGQKISGMLMKPSSLFKPEVSPAPTTTPFEMQFKVLVPANATSLAFTVKATAEDMFGGSSPTSNVKYYVQYGSSVVYKLSGMTATTVKTASFTLTNPAPGPYYVLPVGTSFSGTTQDYRFEADCDRHRRRQL
ncbi:MAG: M4 family metallopeptidase [Myxococcales bacterium]